MSNQFNDNQLPTSFISFLKNAYVKDFAKNAVEFELTEESFDPKDKESFPLTKELMIQTIFLDICFTSIVKNNEEASKVIEEYQLSDLIDIDPTLDPLKNIVFEVNFLARSGMNSIINEAQNKINKFSDYESFFDIKIEY